MSTSPVKEKYWPDYIMPIDYALILSAGLGSRMGEIGKRCPKALWPIFHRALLELQIDYCHDLGVRKIFINTHFLAEEIEKYVKGHPKFSGVTLLHEDPLLDSGGAIHNLAATKEVGYRGILLLVNADQFLFFDQKYFTEALMRVKKARAVLFGITVDKEAKYNETLVVDGHLKSIRKPDGKKNYATYSGLGLLNLEGLSPVPGISKFFETVANYLEEDIEFIVPESYEYWDFGTADIYFQNIKRIHQKLKNKEKGRLMEFLSSHQAFEGNEDHFFNAELNSINLESGNTFQRNSIIGRGLIQEV